MFADPWDLTDTQKKLLLLVQSGAHPSFYEFLFRKNLIDFKPEDTMETLSEKLK